MPLSLKRAAPFILSLFAGGAAALSMAPANFWPILFVALGGLYYFLSSAASLRTSFALGWLFGFGYFVCGLYWTGNALLVEGNPFVWVYPLAIGGLPVLLAVFPAIAATLSVRFFRFDRLDGYLAFSSLYVLFEWVRGHIFTGFPWNLFGYTWIDVLPIVQIVWLSDTYVLTWLTLLWVTMPAFVLLWDASTKHKIALGGFVIASFIGVYVYGHNRISGYVPSYQDNIRVKVVQPNIPQHEKWNSTRMADNFFKHVRMSYPSDHSEETTYIIWPETALHYAYATDSAAMSVLTQALSSYSGKAYLFTGLLRRDFEKDEIGNALVMIDSEGEISNIYDKHHLVPFGEYIPLQKWIPVKPIVQFSGFTEGEGLMSFATPEGLSYSPLVCYEVIFPNKAALRGKDQRPDFIITVTNDGWYGDSAGPRQHYIQAAFRAVEEGMPLVRAANTGISGVVDPLGRSLVKIPLMSEGTEISALPAKVVPTHLSYVAFKRYVFWLFTLSFIVWAYFLRKIIKTNYSFPRKKVYSSGYIHWRVC
jgi:apolipoprotein N-acyltransferase